MKNMLTTLSLALLVAGSAFAQAEISESRTAAARLLDVLQMAENFDNSIKQAIQMQNGMLDQMDLSEEEKVETKKCMEKSMQIVMDKFSWANMKEMFVDIYAEVFSAEELQGIINFYESPAGQKFVVKQPQLTQVTMQKMQGIMVEMMPEIQKETLAAVEKAKQVIASAE